MRFKITFPHFISKIQNLICTKIKDKLNNSYMHGHAFRIKVNAEVHG